MRSPRELGFVLPPEWVPQAAVWMSWPPANTRHWAGRGASIQAQFAQLAALISRFEMVRINAAAPSHENIWRSLREAKADLTQVELFPHANDDVWCRDHGPLFVKNEQTGEVAVTDWKFNGWGGRFLPFHRDDEIPQQVARALDMRCFQPGLVLEGGAIEVNGVGQLLTTEAVLLNPNRNPGMTREKMEAELWDWLGVQQTLWLGSGIEGDDTGGHVDDFARFVDDQTILCCVETNPASPNHSILRAQKARLQKFLTTAGRPFQLVEIALPDPCEFPGWRLPILPASYANYLLINGAVLVPTFAQPSRDQRALGLISDLFPDREVLGMECLDLVIEGGAIHCLTQQQPA